MSNLDWAITPEQRALVARALANGADDCVLSSEDTSRVFIAEKERLRKTELTASSPMDFARQNDEATSQWLERIIGADAPAEIIAYARAEIIEELDAKIKLLSLKDRESKNYKHIIETKDSGSELFASREDIPIRIDPYNGLDKRRPYLPREDLVNKLMSKLETHRIVHIGSPSASGKTTLLELLMDKYKVSTTHKCKYLSMISGLSAAELLKVRAGIDINLSKVDEQYKSTPKVKFIIILDDAQKKYTNMGFWEKLVKTDAEAWLPANISFIFSATYSLNTSESPVSFVNLPRLTYSDLILTDEEASTFIDMNSKMDQSSFGRLIGSPALKVLLLKSCNRHIGALTVSIVALTAQFRRTDDTTLEEVINYYFSSIMTSQFNRCFYSGVASLSSYVTNLLKLCSRERQRLTESNFMGDSTYHSLVRSGVLIQHSNGLEFSCPVALRFISSLLYPNRSLTNPASPLVLMTNVIKGMSSNTLSQSTVGSFPSEATFQHLMMEGLQRATTSDTSICPELSKLFPPEDVASASHLPPVTGRVDFFLDGSLRWCIEALINGDNISEHISRLEGNGSYVGLNPNDFMVVDFRCNATGRASSNILLHPNRMTVFFKKGSFTSCSVVYGRKVRTGKKKKAKAKFMPEATFDIVLSN